jgi:hypothetical protein
MYGSLGTRGRSLEVQRVSRREPGDEAGTLMLGFVKFFIARFC